jgi:hypothetical protein
VVADLNIEKHVGRLVTAHHRRATGKSRSERARERDESERVRELNTMIRMLTGTVLNTNGKYEDIYINNKMSHSRMSETRARLNQPMLVTLCKLFGGGLSFSRLAR